MSEDVILEKEVEYYDGLDNVGKASIKIYPSRLVIIKRNSTESLLIKYINVLKFHKDDKSSYLSAGILLAIFSLPFFLVDIKNSVILETPFKEIVALILSILAIILIVSWWYYRVYVLTINSFNYQVQLGCRQKSSLEEVYKTLEKLRSQDFEIKAESKS